MRRGHLVALGLCTGKKETDWVLATTRFNEFLGRLAKVPPLMEALGVSESVLEHYSVRKLIGMGDAAPAIGSCLESVVLQPAVAEVRAPVANLRGSGTRTVVVEPAKAAGLRLKCDFHRSQSNKRSKPKFSGDVAARDAAWKCYHTAMRCAREVVVPVFYKYLHMSIECWLKESHAGFYDYHMKTPFYTDRADRVYVPAGTALTGNW